MNKIIQSTFSISILIAATTALAGEDLLPRLSTQYDGVKVERVIQSNLIELDNGKKVHLIGLKVFDQPQPKKDIERDKNGFIIEDAPDPLTSLEDEASAFADDLMEHKSVRVEFDTQSTDDDGNSWGYVFFSDGTMANAEILRQGFAELQIRPPNVKYAEQLRQAYRESRMEKRGIQSQ